MKTRFKPLLLLLLVFSFLLSCTKNAKNGVVNGKPTLTLSNAVVNRGQQMTAEVTGLNPGSKISWAVQPAGRNIISSSGAKSMLQFISAGKYTLTASYLDSSSGAVYDSSTLPISVSDSIQTTPTPIPTSDTISIAGTQLHVQPVWADSGLVMIVSSDSIYKGWPFFLGYSWSYELPTTTDPSLSCQFSWLAFYDLPNGSSLNAAVTLVFMGKLFNGYHPFTFNLAGSIYEGGINVSDQTISFTWNYNSGVTISPLVLQKQ